MAYRFNHIEISVIHQNSKEPSNPTSTHYRHGQFQALTPVPFHAICNLLTGKPSPSPSPPLTRISLSLALSAFTTSQVPNPRADAAIPLVGDRAEWEVLLHIALIPCNSVPIFLFSC